MFEWTKADLIVLPIALVLIVLLSILICFLTRNKSKLVKQIPLMTISVALLILEIVKQAIYIQRGYDLWAIPLHFCSLFLYFFPLASFFFGKVGDFGKTMSFVCGALFLALFYINPDSVIGNACANIFSSFLTFHTFIYHHFIILFFLIMLISKLYQPSKLDFLFAFLGVTLYAVFAIPVAHVLDVNFCSILTSVIPFMEELRLTAGQVFYTIILYLFGVCGGLFAVGLANLVSTCLRRQKEDKSFKIIMKTLKK